MDLPCYVNFGPSKWTTVHWTFVHLDGPLDRLYYGNLDRPKLRLLTVRVGWPSATTHVGWCHLACRWQLRSALQDDRESFSIESGPLLDSKALCQQLRVALQLLYPTPPSILTLVTWVPQSRLAFCHSAHRLAVGPSTLAKPNPTVCSLAFCWRLRSALI